MSTEEFSNEFDTLLNSYASTEFFGKVPNTIELNEYEKSVFLTNAQEEIILDAYNGRNTFNDSFEETEEIRRYLNSLIKTYITDEQVDNIDSISGNSYVFTLPNDLLFITYESVNFEDDNLGCSNSNNISVVPITHDEYHRVKSNPFRNSNKRRVLRLDAGNNLVELISNFNVKNYLIRYISKPTPIILTNLSGTLSIDNISNKTECILHPALHRLILDRAVKLALASLSLISGKE